MVLLILQILLLIGWYLWAPMAELPAILIFIPTIAWGIIMFLFVVVPMLIAAFIARDF